MSWQKLEGKDSHRRDDGAMVHRFHGRTDWAAALPGRAGIPHVIRDARGRHIRKFAGAPAAMAFLDAEHPAKEKVHG